MVHIKITEAQEYHMTSQDLMSGMLVAVAAEVFLHIVKVEVKVAEVVAVEEYIHKQMDPVEDMRQEDMQMQLIF